MPHLHWDDHSTHVMSLVRKLYKNLEFTDCTLDTNGGLVHAHKTILVACSPYLKKVIADHRDSKIIPFHDVKYNDMRLILDFVYFGEVDVSLTDVSSLLETARLLQIPSLSDFSLIFSEKSSSNRSCDGSVHDSGTNCTVYQTKYDDALSVEDTEVICTQNIYLENEHQLTGNCDSKACTQNVLRDLSQTPYEIVTKGNYQNSSLTKMDTINETTGNFQVDSTPFYFVAVSPSSVKTEHVDDEFNTSCGTVENPLEDNRVSGDTTKEIKQERDLQSESEMKREIKEEENIYESDECEPMEINYISHGVDDNISKHTENICGKKSDQTQMSIETVGCDSSKGCFAEGMKDLKIEFESICDIPKCEWSEVKPYETSSDNKSINGNNILLTSTDMRDSLECEAETIPMSNYKEDENRASCVSNTERVKINELSVIRERIGCCSERKLGNNRSALGESCKSLKSLIQPIKKENEMEISYAENLESSQSISGCFKTDHQHLDTLGADCNIQFTERKENVNCSQKLEVKQRSNNSGELKLFSCHICEQSFDESEALKKHLLIHVNEKLFLCNICNSSYGSEYSLLLHTRTHTGDSMPKKGDIRATFSQYGSSKLLKRSRTGEKPFKCIQCGASYARKDNLNVHLHTHTREKPFMCNDCGASFARKDILNVHMRIHTGEKPYKCNECSALFARKGDLNVHMRSHTGEKPFNCNDCGVSFAQKSNLNKHMRSHTGEKPFKCIQCGASFAQIDNLNVHMRSHTGEKPFKCNDCGASFAHKGSLNKHMRSHTGEKPFNCNDCGASFAQKGHLNIHVLTHTGEKPLKCNECRASFARKRSLISHMVRHTGEKPFKCNDCGTLYARKDHLNVHMRIHTGEKPYMCNECGATYSSSASLKRHMCTHTVQVQRM